jgi:hypothetical protein
MPLRSSSSLPCYRVALLAHGLLYDEVQARTPQEAVRRLMRAQGLAFVHVAHVHKLTAASAPALRFRNVRCRLPRREEEC